MKKRAPYLFIVAIYVFTLSLGYGFAGLRQANAKSFIDADPRQTNWILVHVDQMDVEQPKLVSVWGMFLTFSPGPQLYFKSFYSAGLNPENNSELASQFSVLPDRTLSEGFQQALDQLNIHRSGLVIMDDEGFGQFTAWFRQPVEASRPLVPPTGLIQPGTLETNSYQDICATLSSSESRRAPELSWDQLYPDHLLAQPSLESLKELWGRVVQSNIPPHCEVLPFR